MRHATTSSPEEAAALYAQHALVLNVPLNHGPGHRFFEVMAAGVPQVVFGDPVCFGPAVSRVNQVDALQSDCRRTLW